MPSSKGDILNPMLIANESLDCRRRSGEPGILCKMDGVELGKSSNIIW
jgi:hypothetical protein